MKALAGSAAVYLLAQIDVRLGAIALVILVGLAIAIGSRDGYREQPRVVTRMPSRWQQRNGTRWVPGVGIGVGYRHGFRPFAFLSIHRWRR